MPGDLGMSWDVAAVTTTVGGTAVATYTETMPGAGPRKAELDTLLGGVATAEVSSGSVTFTGVSVGEVTIPAYSQVGSSVYSGNPITISVTAAVEDESYLNKRGLTHFWENIDDIKQNKLTAGAGILITNDVISATGGGTADAVDWGHITGSMSNQTDLTTALAAKANSADLATVATSGDYDDLTDKPTIGNATLTIQKNGTSVGAFTANATSNKSINITVPTTAADVSALPASTKYGASITVTIDPSDYKVTTTLKDQDGNRLGAAQTIDLPLESVVVSGSYDNTNKKIVLTLQSGSTIDIPVGDLVAGLQSEITSTNKLTSDLVDDTSQTHKFVTAAQITKLSGIAAGAEVNVQSDWDQTTTTADDYIKNKPSIPTKTSDLTNDSDFISDASYVHTDNNYTTTEKNKLSGIAAGAEVNVQANWTQTTTTADDYIKNKPTLATVATSGSYNDLSNKPTIPAAQVQSNWAQTTTTAVDYIKNKPTLATVATSGSYNDLSNKPTIPAAQVNSDWDATSGVAQILNKPTLATVATSGSYNDLSNKPTIPTVNNATLTIQKNGTTVKTFTANASSNVTANITVPTKTSDITNDSNFVASGDLATVATSGSYNDLSNKPTIPTVNNATLTIQKNGTTVKTFTANASSNVTANITVPTTVAELSDASTYVTQNSLATQLANKQNTLTAGDHINITGGTIKAVDYVHSDDPVSTTAVTPVVTNNMIADGTITADKLATGATVKLTLSTSDIGEGSALAANTLYGVYI